MDPVTIDLAPDQIVRWLLDEVRRDRFDLLVNTTRSYRTGELTSEESARLDDEDNDGVREILEVGTLEVRPRRRPHDWVLRVRVEDDIGPCVPEDESVPVGEEEIDLAAFSEEFINRDRGIAEATAEVEGPAAKASLNRILQAILTDRHERATWREM